MYLVFIVEYSRGISKTKKAGYDGKITRNNIFCFDIQEKSF